MPTPGSAIDTSAVTLRTCWAPPEGALQSPGWDSLWNVEQRDDLLGNALLHLVLSIVMQIIYVKAGLCHCTMLYDFIFQLFLWLLSFVKICLNWNLQKLRIKHQPMKRSVCFRTRGWNDVMNIQFCIREQRALFVDSIQLILGYMQFCVAPLLGPIWNKDVYIDTVKPLLALITLFQFFTSQQIKLGIWTNATLPDRSVTALPLHNLN